MMDKHGTDYKAMARDPRNHYQETPKAIESKVRRFIRIPEHYAVYCRERGLLNSSAETTSSA
jgi:Ribosome biogenesis protein Nop16